MHEKLRITAVLQGYSISITDYVPIGVQVVQRNHLEIRKFRAIVQKSIF